MPAVATVLLLWITGSVSGLVHQPPQESAPPTADGGQQPPRAVVIVEGQVTDHVGAGQKDVAVTVRRKSKDDGDAELIAATTTDEFGDFAVTTVEPVHGQILVLFSKPFYADLTRELYVDDDEFPPFLAETLPGKLMVIGRILHALTGEPLAGAAVTLEAGYSDWHEKTDDQGRFTIKEVIPGRGGLIVEAEAYGRERRAIPRLEDFGEIIVHVKPERVVRIEVVGELAKPIAGVTVEVYDQPRDDLRTAVTDDKGQVTCKGLHFDAALLGFRLTHDDYVSDEWFDREVVTPEDKSESTHRLVMAHAGRITGRITDATSGEPLTGVRVMTGVESTDSSPRDWSDYKGEYVIAGVRPGTTTVTAHLSGYAPDLSKVVVRAGESARLDFSLSEGTEVVGRVKDDDGKPVADAYIEARRWRDGVTLGLRAVTDSTGEFVISSAPHDEFEISVWARDHGQVKRVVNAGQGRTGDILQVTLPRAPSGAAPQGLGGLKVGDSAPAVTLTTLGGKTINLADLRGRIILLDFWATWCAPCVEEFPHLIAVHEKFGARKDFVMIGISRDFEEGVLRDFLKKNDKIKWPQAVGETACRRFGVTYLPRLFIIGPDGKIIADQVSGQDIAKRVEQVLKDYDPT